MSNYIKKMTRSLFLDAYSRPKSVKELRYRLTNYRLSTVKQVVLLEFSTAFRGERRHLPEVKQLVLLW